MKKLHSLVDEISKIDEYSNNYYNITKILDASKIIS